jgi:5-methylcytosine-specific restriction protein A
MFPLRVVDGGVLALSVDVFREAVERNERWARRLSDRELQIRVSAAPGIRGRRPVVSNRFERNPWVGEQAKRRAKGMCQLCN